MDTLSFMQGCITFQEFPQCEYKPPEQLHKPRMSLHAQSHLSSLESLSGIAPFMLTAIHCPGTASKMHFTPNNLCSFEIINVLHILEVQSKPVA